MQRNQAMRNVERRDTEMPRNGQREEEDGDEDNGSIVITKNIRDNFKKL